MNHIYRSEDMCLFFFIEFRLIRAMDSMKDQTFFLCHLKESILSRIEFPIGHMVKNDVKQLANELGLERIAKKVESKERERSELIRK